MKHISYIFFPIFMLILITGCNKKKSSISTSTPAPATATATANTAQREVKQSAEFSIIDFDALTNCTQVKSDSLRIIYLDYFDAINTGFIIPTNRQNEKGRFLCKFKIKNNSGSPKRFSYKIFYQNESYKFPEKDTVNGNFNPYAFENFYGSWSDSTVLFRTTSNIPSDGKFHVINDSINITGNPRNEEMCYFKGKNNRWKRNPRVGIYSFLLAVTSEENIRNNNIPSAVQNISLRVTDNFIHPYFYFKYGEGEKLNNTLSLISKTWLKVVANPDLGSGIFVDNKQFTSLKDNRYSGSNCGTDTNLFRKSGFEQFLHYIDASTRLDNIPVIADVLKDNYSKRDYNWNRGFYSKEELIGTTPMKALIPCETVYSDPVNKKIIIHNPKAEPAKWKKENVGIISRHGLCYGKIRVKAKLTELLNKNNMWNGLTNAIWLINQADDGKWNLRRPCQKEGYMATYWGGENDKRVNRVGYSEIDFEILKTPAYCPDQFFPPLYKNPTNNPRDINSWNTRLPDEITSNDGNITVACTNWDMACWEPENFGAGCNTVKYGDKIFEAHRWNHTYRALTEKTPAPDDSLFGSKYYYFEIDWRPEEIIWRIGPEPDQMHVVGYMNNKVTSIPNNQMLLIVTQEFHNTKWWPGSPYQQDNIPFPANDIFGEIYDVTIE